ncbi:MAG: hypothetical protein IPL61_15720 [Myxococcales bacterium]|nr:hypothetical protein [Myxococcales bacterium]
MRTALALSFVLALAACGGKAKPATTPAPDATAVESAAPGGDDQSTDDEDGAPKGGDPDEASADPCGGGE